MKNIKKILLIFCPMISLIWFLVYGRFSLTLDEWGYQLDPFYAGVYDGNSTTCKMATNNWSKSIFIPQNTVRERTAFTSNHPSYISISTYNQPHADNTSPDSCLVWLVSTQSEADCHANGVDRCYRWSCETECWTDDWSYVDIGGWACFVAGTKITLANWHKVAIESISTWDILVGWSWSINNVEKLYKIFYKRGIYSLNGSDYFVSDSHPFMTTEWWKSFNPSVSAKENPTLIITKLSLWDVLVTDHGLEKLITLNSRIDPQYVYNFEVSGNHTYFAHGYLVHNKTPK